MAAEAITLCRQKTSPIPSVKIIGPEREDHRRIINGSCMRCEHLGSSLEKQTSVRFLL